MHHFFSFKSMAFYGSAIGSVIVLFGIVTTYGEAQLKAPPRVEGDYRFTRKNLPGCLNGQSLILQVQQSGIFLTGELVLDDTDEELQKAKKNPTLTGNMSDRLTLHGIVNIPPDCKENVIIQAQVSSSTPTVKDSPRVLKGFLQKDFADSVEFIASQKKNEKVPD